jgi:hypothetical protein
MINKEYNNLIQVCHRERINASIEMILAEIRSGKSYDEIVSNLHMMAR